MHDLACPFCSPEPETVFYGGRLAVALWESCPVSRGHALLIPRRHIGSWFDATLEEQQELQQAIGLAREKILERFPADGFNIGFDEGTAAGQTIAHLHIHVIPRYRGDADLGISGIRYSHPSAGVAEAGAESGESTIRLPHRRSLVVGETDPLYPHLVAHIAQARQLDIAVAFILRSGVALLVEHFRDLLERGGRIRLITGDYFDVTDPDALMGLLDLAAQFPGQVDLRVFSSTKTGFHPKAYLLHTGPKEGVAFVGSSNLTRNALVTGIEWNYRAGLEPAQRSFREVLAGFEQLFRHPVTVDLDGPWVDEYRARRKTHPVPIEACEDEPEANDLPPAPHNIQRAALEALEETRRFGNGAGLVVLATGLGKTWLAAFDSCRPEFRRILFVAHRQEILSQAMETFRRIRPDAHLGLYMSGTRQKEADVLFASIQTMGRQGHLDQFDASAFDYIIVDEFHHASAQTYRRLLAHFDPKFLLGLTATPERTDGGDLLSLCQENLVFRRDVFDGIRQQLLAPFHYFGVPDEVDYSNIPWRGARFDEAELTRAVATQRRAQNILEQYRKRAGKRSIGFCVSRLHADFMKEYFVAEGIPAVSVHSGSNSDPRAASLESLASGGVDIVFVVDMFNEGVDIPAIDTVLMLRPTESRIIWLQQFGRGLRRSEGKPYLTVIDYIGNHRSFLTKPNALLAMGGVEGNARTFLDELHAERLHLPEGCEVTYELEAVDILESLLPPRGRKQALLDYYRSFRQDHGKRPTTAEAFHDRFDPRLAKGIAGSWFGLVAQENDLSEAARMILQQQSLSSFLRSIETTPMTKSFKMLVLEAMLEAGQFPGELPITELSERVRRIASRSARLQQELGAAFADAKKMHKLLEQNPIKAWCGGKGTGGQKFFEYQGQIFRTRFDLVAVQAELFREMVEELIEWRMADYLARKKEVPKVEAEPQLAVVLPFKRVEPKPGDQFRSCVPLVTLKAAAGGFGDAVGVEEADWVEPNTRHRLEPGMFVAQVVGKSMEPKIPDGAYCLFRTPVVGSRSGKILLVQHREIHDPEAGGSYTVKVFDSSGVSGKEGEQRRGTIYLRPLNPDFSPIVLEDGGMDDDVQVIAELVDVLGG